MAEPPLSPLATHIQTTLPSRPPPAPQTTAHHALALQVQHNLQHAHQWTSLQLHTHSPLAPHAPLPRPLLSGMPPRRLYIHPDEQVEILKEQAARRNAGEAVDEPRPEREWVVPTHLREKWTLARLAGVFDRVGQVPPAPDGEGEGEEAGKWRTVKRAMLGIVEDDSTVVYYLVHDGLVKPRQN
ncbi:tRNA-splicing endonuclease subunit Sen15 [Macrophomina phaseolina]|uniref:tRNA-splicing endonuclease subunit Sen15 n=1 Tax=Macrophomina phaseolina TaxID=35725 RepID=A0ABQ8G7N4_9PEZI|nr:tRNA-splicing endonuclease subunit Sen15 [Macrophomina phaseolina]